MMFGSDDPAEQQQHSGGAAGGRGGPGPPASGAGEGERLQQQTPVPFSGGRKPTPRSVRIVSMQDSNAATSATGGPGAGGCRGEQQGTDRTTTTRVSRTAGVTLPFVLLHPSSAPLYGPVVVVRKRLRLVDSRQRHFFLLPRYRMPACVPLSRHGQSSDLWPCTSNSSAIRPSKRAYISTYGSSSLSHTCPFRCFSISTPYTSWSSESSRVRARAERRCRCCVFAEPSLSIELQSSLIRTRPEFPAQVVTGSWAPLHTSRAGSSGYSASFLVMRSFTLIIVSGASVSNEGFDVI
jgi:hypothetical protein